MFTHKEYLEALKDAGPKLTENILERAEKDEGLSWEEFKNIVDYAYERR